MRSVDFDRLRWERFPHQETERVEILFDGEVIKLLLSGFAPDHQRRRAVCPSVDQNFVFRDRRGVDDIRIAGGNAFDVRGIVENDTLSHRKLHVLCVLRFHPPGATKQDNARRKTPNGHRETGHACH